MAFRPATVRTEAEQRRLMDLLDRLPIIDRSTPLPRSKLKLGKTKGGKLRRLEQRRLPRGRRMSDASFAACISQALGLAVPLPPFTATRVHACLDFAGDALAVRWCAERGLPMPRHGRRPGPRKSKQPAPDAPAGRDDGHHLTGEGTKRCLTRN